MNLAEIVWPVYRLGENKPHQVDGVVFYYTHYVDHVNQETFTTRVVDDTNLPYDTLGRRRLALKIAEDKLFPIRTAIYFLSDLIKLAKPTTWFIDSSGKVFQYTKTARAKLQTKKIKQVLPGDGIGCIIEAEGIPGRFKCMRRPQEYEIYVRVLKLGLGYLLYGFSDELKADSWRLV